jgi:hypothetical protein
MLRRSHVSASGVRRRRDSQPSFGGEKSLPHARQDRQASSVSRPLEGRQRRKSPVRRCFKSRPPFGGVRRFASGCRSFLGTVDWPLVQIPADRHTTTGTCVLGKTLFVRIVGERKCFFAPTVLFSFCHITFTSAPPRQAEIGPSASGVDAPARPTARAGGERATRPRVARSRSNRSTARSLSQLAPTNISATERHCRVIEAYVYNFL